jgi:hypothetical protein
VWRAGAPSRPIESGVELSKPLHALLAPVEGFVVRGFADAKGKVGRRASREEKSALPLCESGSAIGST